MTDGIVVNQQDMISIAVAENGHVTLSQPSSDGSQEDQSIWFWPEHIEAVIEALIAARTQIETLANEAEA